MKTAKLNNVSTNDAGRVAQVLGAKVVLYRDAPLFDKSQIVDLVKEFKTNKADSIIFDAGAIFDEPAYDLAYEAVAKIKTVNVVVYNFPKNGR